MSNFTLRTSDGSNVAIADADDRTLAYWAGRLVDDLDRDPDGKWADSDRAKLAAIQREQADRGGAAPRHTQKQTARREPAPNGNRRPPSRPRNPPPRRAIERVDPSSYRDLLGAYSDAKAATEAMEKLAEIGHLISPAPAVASVPEGCEILVAAVYIDPDRETYSIAGDVGLSKVALNKLAGAAGICWSTESRRMDDGSDRQYVHWCSVGHVRDFSGQLVPHVANKRMDLRDDSPTARDLQNRSENKARRTGGQVADWRSQLRDMRLFILEHAETKAKNRLLRDALHLRTSYTADELRKPFFAVRLQFTGRTSDPELRRLFAARIADSFLGASAAMFGPAATPPVLPPASPMPPPPVGTPRDREDNDEPIETYGRTVEHDADGVVDDRDYPAADGTEGLDEFPEFDDRQPPAHAAGADRY